MAEELAEKQVEENKPAGVLASVWNSFSMWDSTPKADEKMKLWTYFSALVALGEISLNQLALLFKEREWLSIGLTARRSWKMCEEAEGVLKQLNQMAQPNGYILPESDREEEVDVLSRLEFLIGLYHFMVSLVPPSMLVFVEAIGFEADRKTGIKDLQSAAGRKGIHFVTTSIVLIAYHNFFMQTDEPANAILENLFANGYSDSPAVRMMAGTVARRQGKIQRAIECYHKGIEGVKNQQQVVLILEMELGNTYFMEGNWAKAAEYFERFITHTTNRQYKCFVIWKLGFCLWMMNVDNRVERVSKLNNLVIETADDRFAYERYSARTAKRFISQKRYTSFEELWYHAWSFNQARRFEDSNEILQKAVDIVKTESSKGPDADLPQSMVECVSLCLYLKMSNFNGMEKMEDATEALQKLLKIQNEVVDELWVMPHAYVEMGELCLKLASKGVDAENLYKKAQVCFERATSFTNYDFDRPLSFRIARGRDLLRNI